MSITIRLAKTGKKNAHSFRIVVSNTKDKRNGKFLDVLGFFNPNLKENQSSIDIKRLETWKSNGALISKAVSDLVTGSYKFVKYAPKSKE